MRHDRHPTRRGVALRILLAALIGVVDAAAAATLDSDALRFRRYDVDAGLSDNYVRAMVQDAEGYLWIGTQLGLNRFDGYDFRVYRRDGADAAKLSDNIVMAIAAGADGAVWVGTASGGLNRYDPVRDRFDTFRAGPGGLVGDQVRGIVFDETGMLWLSVFGVGVQRFDPQRLVALDMPLGREPALSKVRDMIMLGDGRMLVSAETDVWLWDGPGTQPRGLLRDAADGVRADAASVAFDPARQEIWIGLIDGGVLRLREDGRRIAHYRGDGLPSDAVGDVLVAHDGRVWVSTSAGVAVYARDIDGFVARFSDAADSSSPPLSPTVLYEDRSGMVWVGSFRGGFGVHDPDSEAIHVYHRRLPLADALPASAVRAVLANDDGTLMLGLGDDGGLVQFRPGTGVLRMYRHDPADPASLGDDDVVALARARDGALWIGFALKGLDRLAPGSTRFEHFRATSDRDDALPGDLIDGLYIDPHDTLWVATDGGGLAGRCARCAGFKRYPEDARSPLRGASVVAARMTADDELWFGMFAGGVGRLDVRTGTIDTFRTGVGVGALSDDVVRSVLVDSGGDVWLGTGAGLDRVVRDRDPARVRFESKRGDGRIGLRNVSCLLEDSDGDLWIAATEGLRRFDPRDGAITALQSAGNFDRAGYFSNACARSGRTLLFGGPRGLVALDPAALPRRRDVGPLVLGDLTVLDRSDRSVGKAVTTTRRPLRDGDAIELDYREEVFGFDFAALDYRDPDSVEYRYRLDPLHGDWIPSSSRERNVTFASLPAGDYTLRVQALRDGSVPSEAKVTLKLPPPPWRSPLAYFAYVALAVTALTVVLWRAHARVRYERRVSATIRRSEEALRQLNEELESRVAARTSDLSAVNADLTTTLASLREAQQQLVEAEKMASLGGLVAGVAHEINTPLGICVTAASHLVDQAARLRTAMASGELRRSDLAAFETAAHDGAGLILRNLRRADELVRNFKQLAVDQSTEQWRMLELGEALRNIVEMLLPAMRGSRVEVIVDAAPSLLVESSPGALYQVISNLVLNAMIHGYDAGAAGRVAITAARRDDGDLEIVVADDGRGMTPQVRARAFEPFFTTRRGEGGSGLGLHVVFNLVTQVLRGGIACDSAPGRGTRFTIRLPATRKGS